MNRETKIRCRCDQCKNTQLVKVQEYLAVTPKCWRQSLTTSPCGGTLGYYADDEQDTLLNASAILQYIRNVRFDDPKLAELVDIIADDLGAWAEGPQSPQQMGWVDSKGRP